MLFQSINKFKRSSIIVSIVLMALGLIMVICPGRYVSSLISAIGYGSLILAAIMILEYLDSKRMMVNTIMLVCAIIIGLLGVSVLVFEEYILQILGWVFGIILFLQGIEMLYNALMYVRPSGRSGWWLLAILAVALIAAGVAIILNMWFMWWDTPKALLQIIGIALMFDAAVSIVRLVLIWPIQAE